MSVTFRLTAKLGRRVNEPLVTEPPPSTGILGDWYADLLYFDRQQIILAVSEKSFLPILLLAKDAKSFLERLAQTLASALAKLGVPASKVEKEISQMAPASFAKTASRQVLGIMNQMVKDLEWISGYRTFWELEQHLADRPCKPLKMDSPDRYTRKLFDAPPPHMRPHLRLVTGTQKNN